jgi:hypothetical protein
MAQHNIQKKLRNNSRRSSYQACDNSPAVDLIGESLKLSLQKYLKPFHTNFLSKVHLVTLLWKLKFLKSIKVSDDEIRETEYMWNILSKNDLCKIHDIVCYLFCLLKLNISDNLLDNSIEFKKLHPHEYSCIEQNSQTLLTNYLEQIYSQFLTRNKENKFTLKDKNFFYNKARKSASPKVVEDKEKILKVLENQKEGRNWTKKNSPIYSNTKKLCGKLKKNEGSSKSIPFIGIEITHGKSQICKLRIYKDKVGDENIFMA